MNSDLSQINYSNFAGTSKSSTDLSSSIDLNSGAHIITVWWDDQNGKLQWYLGNIANK